MPQNPSFFEPGDADCESAAKKTSSAAHWLISTYPMLIVIAVLFVLISGMAAMLCYRHYETAETKALSADQMTSELLAVFIREREKAVSGLLQAYAGRSSFIAALANQDRTALRRHLAELKKNPEVDVAIVTDAQGVVQTQSPLSQNTSGNKVSTQKWFKEAISFNKPAASLVSKSPAHHSPPAVLIATPVLNGNDELVGVLAAVQRLDFIARGIEKLQLGARTGISVIDASGRIFFSNRHPYLNGLSLHPESATALQALRDNRRQITVTSEGEPASYTYLSLSAVENTGWKVVVEREQKDILHSAYRYFIEIAVMGFLLFACLSVFLIYLRKVFLLRQARNLLDAEVKLRQSEHRLNELFENMSSGVAIFGARADGQDFVFKEINQAALSSERLVRQDVIGQSVCDVFEGVREFGLFDLLHRVWQTGESEYLQARYYRKDRRRSWKQNSVYRLPTGDVVIIFNDISKKKRAEETLKRSEETFAKVFKANPAAIAICRQHDGCILDVNVAFENLIGYRREELIGQNATSLGLWADASERNVVMQALSGQSSIADREVRLLTKNGKTLIANYSAESVKLATESCLLSIIVDVTAARQAEEERRKLERQLYESQKMQAIGTLAGGIAHDFNNILGAIIGYAEMAALQPDPKKMGRYMDQILAAGMRAKDLVSQILTFSRHSERDKKPMDLKIIAKETLRLLRSTLPASIEIRQAIENIPHTIDGDPTQMHQIIMNICTNAAHAMGEKGGVLNFSLTGEELSLSQADDLQLKPGSYVRLSISDTGCGIDPGVIDRIFDPFFTTKKIGEGTGLGLAVVYGIVKNHEGHVQVKSEPRRGASFDIYLPRLEGNHAVVSDVAGMEPIAGGRESILFVDDEKTLVDLAHRNLSALGYRVTACSDSQEALKIFQSDPDGFDLIITDMTMPKISGSELTRQIACLRPAQPVILCTGFSEYINPEKAAQMGIKDFILKPLSRKTLALAVRKALDDPAVSIPRRAEHHS